MYCSDANSKVVAPFVSRSSCAIAPILYACPARDDTVSAERVGQASPSRCPLRRPKRCKPSEPFWCPKSSFGARSSRSSTICACRQVSGSASESYSHVQGKHQDGLCHVRGSLRLRAHNCVFARMCTCMASKVEHTTGHSLYTRKPAGGAKWRPGRPH